LIKELKTFIKSHIKNILIQATNNSQEKSKKKQKKDFLSLDMFFLVCFGKAFQIFQILVCNEYVPRDKSNCPSSNTIAGQELQAFPLM